MRLYKIILSIVAIASCSSSPYAQEGNAAEPSIYDRPLDLMARQAPWGRWNIDITGHDRVYSIGPSENSIAVTDPYSNMFVGSVRFEGGSKRDGMQHPSSSSFAQTFGYAPNGRTLAIAPEASRSVTFLDTRSNSVIHTAAYEGLPVGVSYSGNGKEVWIPVRGGNYVSVLDAKGFAEIVRVPMPDEPGPTVLSNNGRYAYVCSGSGIRTKIVDVAKRTIVGSVPQGGSPCTSIAASPDGRQVWLTSGEGGRTVAFSAKPPFEQLRSVNAGPGTSHVNFVSNDDGQFAYVSVAGANAVKVFDTQTFEKVATIRVGKSPSGLWPSGDGSRMYVALKEDGAVAVIDTAAMKYIDLVEVGQAVQDVVYVPNAVRSVRDRPNIEAPPASEPE